MTPKMCGVDVTSPVIKCLHESPGTHMWTAIVEGRVRLVHSLHVFRKKGMNNITVALHWIRLSLCLWLLSGCNSSMTDPTVPAPSGGTSFRSAVLPILRTNRCETCHGGTSGLTVGTVAGLLHGGDHGPAVLPGNADSSLIIRKLSPSPPFGSRMPLGGPYLPDSTVAVIRAWINEGAKDN